MHYWRNLLTSTIHCTVSKHFSFSNTALLMTLQLLGTAVLKYKLLSFDENKTRTLCRMKQWGGYHTDVTLPRNYNIKNTENVSPKIFIQTTIMYVVIFVNVLTTQSLQIATSVVRLLITIFRTLPRSLQYNLHVHCVSKKTGHLWNFQISPTNQDQC